jgi:hypothetical protein
VTIETADEQALRLQKVLSEDGQELQLYCHSPSRQLKEEAMSESFSQRFEAGLQQILDGLAKPRAEKRPDKLHERIGRLKQKSRGASQHYTVDLVTDEIGQAGHRDHLAEGAARGEPGDAPGRLLLADQSTRLG